MRTRTTTTISGRVKVLLGKSAGGHGTTTNRRGDRRAEAGTEDIYLSSSVLISNSFIDPTMFSWKVRATSTASSCFKFSPVPASAVLHTGHSTRSAAGMEWTRGALAPYITKRKRIPHVRTIARGWRHTLTRLPRSHDRLRESIGEPHGSCFSLGNHDKVFFWFISGEHAIRFIPWSNRGQRYAPMTACSTHTSRYYTFPVRGSQPLCHFVLR